jgi:hypothetical protein
MGYYVMTTESNVFIHKRRHTAAYKALCELNQHDELKTGGSYGGTGPTADAPRPAGMTYHPARWFSWMDANYPEKCKTLEEVLDMVGYSIDKDEDGNITALHYDNKSGCQETFLGALAPYVKDGSYINWQGESGELYRNEFSGGRMLEREGAVAWF